MLKKCVYLLLSFMVGVAGNLIAGWIQQDVWLNAFTPLRIVVTVILACLALLLMVRFERGAHFRSASETHRALLKDRRSN